jgi:hypothetical protein
MGNKIPFDVEIPVDFNCFAVILRKWDKLKVLAAPENIRRTIGDVISSCTRILSKDEMRSYVEYELKGLPWLNETGVELLNRLIKALYASGWHFSMSIDFPENSASSRDVMLIFEKKEPMTVNVMLLSIYNMDKISVSTPCYILETIEQVIREYWALGIQNQKTHGTTWEIKLKGKWKIEGVAPSNQSSTRSTGPRPKYSLSQESGRIQFKFF